MALFKASPKELVPCALVGIVGLAVANTCYYECMGEVGMSTASVLLYICRCLASCSAACFIARA